MGNAAAKEWESTQLLDAVEILKNESSSINPSLVTQTITRVESKGKQWIASDSKDLLWSTKAIGMIKSHSLIRDKDKNVFATVITYKIGMNSITNIVCKSTPSFEGQEPLTVEELKKAGIKEGTILYPFSSIQTDRKMTTAKSTYSIASGIDEDGTTITKILYTGEKLSSMGFMAIMKEGDGKSVAKAKTVGMTMKPVLEAAVGVDLLAVVLMGYALAGSESVGGLVGAGVI